MSKRGGLGRFERNEKLLLSFFFEEKYLPTTRLCVWHCLNCVSYELQSQIWESSLPLYSVLFLPVYGSSSTVCVLPGHCRGLSFLTVEMIQRLSL